MTPIFALLATLLTCFCYLISLWYPLLWQWRGLRNGHKWTLLVSARTLTDKIHWIRWSVRSPVNISSRVQNSLHIFLQFSRLSEMLLSSPKLFGSKEISFPSFVTFVIVGDFSFWTCPRVNGGLVRNTNNKIEIKKLRRESILTF